MNCPNCDRKMKEENHIIYILYKCHSCKIAYDNYSKKWDVPIENLPTKKQENTLFFINSRLGTDFIPVTKKQCSKVISENFEKAKNTPQKRKASSRAYLFTDEDCDEIGLDASMFC